MVSLCCFCIWIRTLTIIIRCVKSLILRTFFIIRAGLGGSDFLAFSFAFGSKEFWTAINLDLSNLVGGGEPPSVDQWLHHLETAYKNHRDLFLGIYRYAFEQLSYDLLIILHRSVLQSVQDGVYIVESGLGFFAPRSAISLSICRMRSWFRLVRSCIASICRISVPSRSAWFAFSLITISVKASYTMSSRTLRLSQSVAPADLPEQVQ